ncbi:hypothetical protein Tco_0069388, partial [Tanacetum coccineum]
NTYGEFMRPFGCTVTIINTLDHLSKFDGKAEEGVLVGYSINSKAFRVYNHRTRIVEENLHVNFLENKPNIAGNRPEWLFDIDSLTNTMNYQPISEGNRSNDNAGKKTNSDAGQDEKEKVPDQECILLPMMHTSSYIPSSPEEDVSSPSDDIADKKTEQDSAIKRKPPQILNDLIFNTVNNPIYTASERRTFYPAGPSSGPPQIISFDGSLPVDVHDYPDDPLMPDLEDTAEPQGTGIFGRAYDDDEFYNSPFDDQNMGAEADINNMEPSIVVSPIPITRIHFIHPKAQIIRDPKSAVQT